MKACHSTYYLAGKFSLFLQLNPYLIKLFSVIIYNYTTNKGQILYNQKYLDYICLIETFFFFFILVSYLYLEDIKSSLIVVLIYFFLNMNKVTLLS